MDAVQVLVEVAHGLLALVELALLVPLLYLALLSVAALFATRRTRHIGRVNRMARAAAWAGAPAEPLRFAILIPAHDEAPVIAGAVASAIALEYPPDRRDIFVVA